MTVVYFDNRMGTLHAVRPSKSYLLAFQHLFLHIKEKGGKQLRKNLQNPDANGIWGLIGRKRMGVYSLVSPDCGTVKRRCSRSLGLVNRPNLGPRMHGGLCKVFRAFGNPRKLFYPNCALLPLQDYSCCETATRSFVPPDTNSEGWISVNNATIF